MNNVLVVTSHTFTIFYSELFAPHRLLDDVAYVHSHWAILVITIISVGTELVEF